MSSVPPAAFTKAPSRSLSTAGSAPRTQPNSSHSTMARATADTSHTTNGRAAPAQADHAARGDAQGLEARALEVAAVPGSQVGEPQAAPVDLDLQVLARHQGIGERERRPGVAAHDDLARAEIGRNSTIRARDDRD